MYDNSEKFITSAYRRKLEEDKQWQESQKLKYVHAHSFKDRSSVLDCLASSGRKLAVASASAHATTPRWGLSFPATSAAARLLTVEQEVASTCIRPSLLPCCQQFCVLLLVLQGA